MAIHKDEYVVRAGSKVIAVRKDWGAAQDSMVAYIRDLQRAGVKYTVTRSQTNKNNEGKSIFASYNYIGDGAKGAILVITITRGS
jgi:hypothetical protein